MAKGILKNVRLFNGGCDLTGASNKVDWSCESETKDVTNFGSVDAAGELWQEVKGGQFSTTISGGGQWEAADASKVDDALWAGRGGLSSWTACPVSANVGDLAYLTQALSGKYALGGQVGDVAPWQADWAGSWPAVRGQILHPPGTARTVTGSGTALELGAVAAGQALYVCLHVLSVAGTATPTITVTMQSDDVEGFGSPTNRGSFTAATAIGGQVLRIPGPVTDTWWRPSWAISGTTPSFLFVVSAGIA